MHRLTLLVLFIVFGLSSNAQNNPENNFVSNPNTEHVVLFIPNESFGISRELAGEVAKYNAKNHIDLKLDLKQYRIPFLSSKATILVRTFKSYSVANEYIKTIQQKNPDFIRGQILEYTWVISIDNFNTLIRSKDKKSYLAFLETLK
jgi:hypothetical protein